MVSSGDREHDRLVRERFTRTAEQFSRFALASRNAEAERLAHLALSGVSATGALCALDLACGPGTFARALAPRVRFVLAMDLTPAMLGKARQALACESLRNFALACADACALPLPDGSLDLAVCGYSLHHMAHPERTLHELARVVRRGGRVGIVDLIVPEGADPALNNGIERARDASHARTLDQRELPQLLESAGLRVVCSETGDHLRDFDDWMRVAGALPGSLAYRETRRLLEASLVNDAAGFRPRLHPATRVLEYVQTSLFVVAEKS